MAESDLPAELLVLVREFSLSGLRELQIRKADFELYLSNDASASASGAAAARAHGASTPRGATPSSSPALPSAPQAAPQIAINPQSVSLAAADIPPDAIILRAPNLGTFYRSPKPGAPSYVEVGSTVAVGDELCLIEVMKLFTGVRAIIAGRIHAVLIEDGAMVEADQPLFVVVTA